MEWICGLATSAPKALPSLPSRTRAAAGPVLALGRRRGPGGRGSVFTRGCRQRWRCSGRGSIVGRGQGRGGGARGGARAPRPPVRLGAASARSSPVPVLRSAGVSPRAPGGGGEPRAARPRADDAAAARSRSAPHPAAGGERRRRRARSRAAQTPPAPRLRPVFLWASHRRDGAVQRVYCEDYDPRNRLHLTRTRTGWTSYPRTDTFDAIWRRAELAQPTRPPQPPPAPRLARRRRRARRARAATSPACLVPDLESHIPEHRIAVTRPPPEPSPPPSTTAPAPHPPPGAPPPPLSEPTPLDSLLAVAELEFNQQRGSELEMEGSRFAFMPPEEPGELFDLGGGKAAGTGDEDDFRDDLFESISEAHYLPALDGADAHFLPTLDVHGESLLQSLVEKGCEDNQILGRLDRLSAQLSTEAAAFEQGLLGEAPVGDLIERLESLESPSRSAAQGLLHLARRPSDVDPFVPDEVFAQEPVPAAAPASAPAPLPPAPPTADLMYADRIPDLPDTFDYEDYEDISPAEVPASVGSAAPTSHIANKAPDEPRPKPESDDNDLGDIKLDILAPDIVDMEDLKMDASELAIPKKEEPREEVEKPTDLSAILEVEPEKRSTPAPEPRRSSPVDILTYSENEAANKIDENLPKDLSIHRRLSSSYASPRRIDIPRAPSRDSDSMQSPQPSGIPAISPSPTNKCRMFLENLYGSTSPKMYTSEVTIQQCVPLNLGKHRKSASPTVSSCSEDVRNVNKDPGEPQEKRVRRESHDLNKICNMLKKCEENRLAEAQQKKKLSEIELLPPLEQLELLKSNKNFNLPDHMLVPRDRLNNIIAAPGKEIPALLMERFQLNMPEILQNPNCMGDLDLMVMSFEQMRQLIIHNDGGQPKPQAENDSKAPEDDTSKESGKVTPVSSGRPASRHSENKSTGSERTATPTGSTPRPHPAVGHLADDIDAANSAAAYQMSWLPAYLNHMSQLEAFAACSQNAEFLKALGSAGYAAGYPAPPHHAYHSRYAALPPAAAAAPPPPLDYESRMQLLMWQEAVHAHARHKRHDAAKDSHVAELAAAYAHHKASYGKHAQRYSRAALPAPALPSYVPRAPPSRSPPHEYMGARRAPELRPRISVKSLTELQQHTAAARRAAPAPPPRRRDEPEVGSTTSVPDLPHLMPPHLPMPPIPHDPTAFPLWHPLFSNQQKGQYTSPWSWTTVTATGD